MRTILAYVGSLFLIATTLIVVALAGALGGASAVVWFNKELFETKHTAPLNTEE